MINLKLVKTSLVPHSQEICVLWCIIKFPAKVHIFCLKSTLLTDCSRADIEVMVTCEADILTVIWPTDIVYDGDVEKVPKDLEEKLNERIEAKGAAFYLFIHGHNPPWVNNKPSSYFWYLFLRFVYTKSLTEQAYRSCIHSSQFR